MSLSVQQLLESKGIQAKPEHLEILESRWNGMQKLRGTLENVKIEDADIGLRNIPGGDHIG
ncbi:hypothetical protein CSV71_11765 [Sporosarcina sp. P21c]|nr:hypothetical protein SporoP8_12975 [Sporosarcina ureae]PIC68107.1 hypothetical protein CSV78_04770 [Sporosarcina sp. P16a]PIC82454.1 hypothetical protein CSV73_12350 [Sporosarcina sp. P1]PIC89048.1 hypothetical protein CSV71_11765 [Sporosarcina sp. P21c]PIC94416.1 hypothetical protein CSV70_01410 [Sporosarcina sp. P25]